MAGLFFYLASADGAGFLFFPAAIQPHTSVYSVVLCRQCSYTANGIKQRTKLYRGFSCDLPHFTAANTRPTQAAIIPPAPRWSASKRRNASSTYTRYQRNAGRCTGQHSRPIIIRYIRAHRLLWIHARQCSISQTMQARRGQLLPPVDRWQVIHPAAPADGSASPLVRGQPGGGRRGTIGGYRRSSFRAFAR